MRLIDADALIALVQDSTILGDGFKYAFVALVNGEPTVDAVQVVRCGECSHSEVCKMDDGDVRYCHIFEMQMEDDYYCADGERREE